MRGFPTGLITEMEWQCRGGSRISSRGGGGFKKIAPSGGRREICWGISCEKSRFLRKKNHIFAILGSAPVMHRNGVITDRNGDKMNRNGAIINRN